MSLLSIVCTLTVIIYPSVVMGQFQSFQGYTIELSSYLLSHYHLHHHHRVQRAGSV